MWKQTYNSKKEIQFKNEDSGKFITINDISGKPFVRGVWYVRVLDYDGIKIKDYTGNKQQSISFAKRWMKAHPNG